MEVGGALMDEYWIWLSQIPGIGHTTQRKLLQAFSSPTTVYQASDQELQTTGGMTARQAALIQENRHLEKARRIVKHCQERQVTVVPWYGRDNHYSRKSLPVVLYMQGPQQLALPPAAALLGSGQASPYGQQLAEKAAGYLARSQITLISLLSEGLCHLAINQHIQEGGSPLVLSVGGAGRHTVWEQKQLAAWERQATVIYLHPPGTGRQRHHFLERNAALAALSYVGFLPEAAVNSHSLAAANVFLRTGCPLFIAPHDLASPHGAGSNPLLVRGAEAYLEPKQLLPSPATEAPAEPVSHPQCASVEQRILHTLGARSVLLGELIHLLPDLSEEKVLAAVSALEIDGQLTTLPGSRIQRERVN